MTNARSTEGRTARRQKVAATRRPRSTPPPKPCGAHPVLRELFAQTRAPRFRAFLKHLLVELCRVDTTPNPDVSNMRAAEARCFDILERELSTLPVPGARLERQPINPAIQTHPNYSLLHFTKTPQRPEGLTAEETYAGRANLVYLIPGANGSAGNAIALNAHLDVVAPYFPPRARGNVVYGRGACDDKGPVVGIIGALKALSAAMAKTGSPWGRSIVGMFVVEEETGGNGSLSLALDRELKKLYDSVLVSECTGLKIYPANRGAVWYRAEIQAPPDVSAFEMFAFINEEFEKEGAAIRAESRHVLFPQRPVQTCHGIIGRFGEHPSRICGEMSFSIQFEREPTPATGALVRDCLESGLAGYLGAYGDKSKVTDPATGRPMVTRHYDLRRTQTGFEVDVHGAAGHMGSIRERDGAITKAAHLLRALLDSKQRIQQIGGAMRLELAGPGDGSAPAKGSPAAKTRTSPPQTAPNRLVLEGGQGFVPTHGIEEVMKRLARAAERGAENYLRRIGRSEAGHLVVKVTYEKLHNVAFDGDPNSAAMKNAQEAVRMCGLGKDEPVLGWTVSCDARLFATEYPGMPVLTFGPGRLVYAHSDQEQIHIEEIRAAAEFLAVFLLLHTGAIQLGAGLPAIL